MPEWSSMYDVPERFDGRPIPTDSTFIDRNQDNPYRPCMVYLSTFTIAINPYMDGMGDVTGKSRLVKYHNLARSHIFTSYPPKKMGRHQYVVGAWLGRLVPFWSHVGGPKNHGVIPSDSGGSRPSATEYHSLGCSKFFAQCVKSQIFWLGKMKVYPPEV